MEKVACFEAVCWDYGVKEGTSYIYLADWESFCSFFINTGKHRFSNID